MGTGCKSRAVPAAVTFVVIKKQPERPTCHCLIKMGRRRPDE